VVDTEVPDSTPPPAPTDVKVEGKTLSWNAEADLESGLARFLIFRDGKRIAVVEGKNRFGRPLFQGLQYSDTPSMPLIPMRFVDKTAETEKTYQYRVVAENTVGLRSK